jgi:hypothetical protein
MKCRGIRAPCGASTSMPAVGTIAASPVPAKPGVVVPAGEGDIEFVFVSRSLKAGGMGEVYRASHSVRTECELAALNTETT